MLLTWHIWALCPLGKRWHPRKEGPGPGATTVCKLDSGRAGSPIALCGGNEGYIERWGLQAEGWLVPLVANQPAPRWNLLE